MIMGQQRESLEWYLSFISIFNPSLHILIVPNGLNKEHSLDLILGQHLFLCKKNSALNNLTISSYWMNPMKGYSHSHTHKSQ